MQEQGTLPTQREPEAVNVRGRNGKGPQQVQNNAGGYVYAVDDMKRLERFIIMGTEGGSYYVKEEELKRENVKCLDSLIQSGQGQEAVELITKVSVERRNVKQGSLILALAICARCNDEDTKRAAYKSLNQICRIPTHLFMFIKLCEQESNPNTGWGRAHKTGIQRWYKQFEGNPAKLARLVTKYKNREDWTHRDVLRLAHPVPNSPAIGYILRCVTRGIQEANNHYIAGASGLDSSSEVVRMSRLMQAYEDAMKCTNADQLCSMIEEYQLNWEHLPTTMLTEAKVWKKLLINMPIEALIRNLGRMTKLGVFPENSEEEDIALEKIRNINTEAEPQEDDVGETPRRRNIIHPFKILIGLVTYKKGRGEKGSLTWIPNTKIITALDGAFYQAFNHVQPTNKKFFLAVDVSGSMSQPVLGSSAVTCAMAAAAMMMTVVRTEKDYTIKGFSHKLVDMGITTQDSLSDVMSKTSRMNFGATNCALPMRNAMENKDKDFDVFIVYTDNETWYGNVHPSEALRQYRMYAQNPAVKLIVCGMCANKFTIADPTDFGMLDIAGFDSAAPTLISDFAVQQ